MYRFRGKLDTGEYVYGNLVQGANTIIVNANGEYKVNPQTISQYAFVDNQGKEVYTGDIVVDQATNSEYIVQLNPYFYKLDSVETKLSLPFCVLKQ